MNISGILYRDQSLNNELGLGTSEGPVTEMGSAYHPFD